MQLSTTKRQKERCLPPNTVVSTIAITHARNDCINSSKTHYTRLPILPLLLLLLLMLTTSSHGYNIDLPSYIRHVREPNTMFGFSIALHKGRSGYAQSNSLIVGAPKFDTSSYQQGVVEAGAVFKCGMIDGDCNLVKFDSSGNHRNTYGDVIERKSYQWLGATVSTSRDNDLIVACAPRYVFHTMTPNKSLRYDPVGTCFTSRNFTHFNEVSPCRTNNWGYHRQGSCQAGFSAAASSRGERLYIGAPGSWYWQGQAYSISPDATFPYKPPFYQPFGTGGQTYSYDVTRPENQVYSTAESSSQDDDSYLGYSMITGDFDGDRVEDIAIGMPRGAGLLGKIVVNHWNMTNIFNFTGHQIGEYFGYALATCDVDGNGLDDLIIGAPMFSEPGNVEGKYDVGRVYILLQKESGERWPIEHIREGYNTKGRFGLALTTLGDINRDGYGDFAVGAPYDGPDGRGIVYIFHGSPAGPLLKPSQIIKAEDIVEGAPYPRTFGFALSGGLDMDGNTYPDLAVGAYASDQVFIFKSRPVAAVNAMTSFVNQSKLISLDDRKCQTVRDGKRVACTEIMTCWSYTGEYLPGSLEFDVSWVLDAKKPKKPRMFFLLDEGKNIRNLSISLQYGKTYCRNETVYLLDNLQDKLTPLEVEMRYDLRSRQRMAPVIRRKRDTLEPVIDQNREIILRDAINIQKNCGLDNICIPDLQLDIVTVDKYLHGSRKPLVVEVTVTNRNEDAFESAFYMEMPKDLDFIKIENLVEKVDTPITCSAPSEANNYTLKCDLGNPLPGQKFAKFNVIMLPSQRLGMSPSYHFYMEANSTNSEIDGNRRDNVVIKNVDIWVETDLAIEGASLPDFQLYKASDYLAVENATKEEDLGPQVVHLYNIRNNGPSYIEEAVILIHYPNETVGGDLLMYVLNQPETHGNIVCDPHLAVNPLRLKLDNNLMYKSYLRERGVIFTTESTSSSSSSSGSGSVTYSGVERSDGSSAAGTAVTIGRGTKELTLEEKRRLEKEDEQEVPGDASATHIQRAHEAAVSSSQANFGGGGGVGTGTGGNYHWSSSSSSSSGGSGVGGSGAGGRGPMVIVRTKNTTTSYDASGRPHVVESSTEYSTDLDQAGQYYSQPLNQNQRQHSANYQQSGSFARDGGHGNYEGVQSTRGHIQMAGAGGSAQQQPPMYSNYIGSSGGAYRPHEQQQQQHQQQQQQYQQKSYQPYDARRGSIASSSNYNTHNNYDNFGGVVGGSNFDKAASGGHGFQAGMLDLGTINRDNVDNELRQHDGQYGGNTGASYGYQQSYTRRVRSPAGNKPYYGMENEDYYDEDGIQQQGVQQQSFRGSEQLSQAQKDGRTYHQSSSSSANSYYNEQGGQHQAGHKASSSSSSSSHSSFSSSSQLREGENAEAEELTQIDWVSPCKAAKCQTLRCVAKNLAKDDGVWVAIRMRTVAKTMEKLAGNLPLNVSTMAASNVTRLPYIGEPKVPIIKTHEIFYKAVPEPIPVPDVVPLWVVVLAACAGALILLLLVYLLYKCGFFNRNRPRDHSMERQPLRNGYHGDEHL
ncbi:integrin alpha-PS2 isoform X1 [Anastrepha ludens]|uniref:integrin alpha-PS2 isoform X1 n=1 Tax=Anastrepha ludens TaxID=28586 RepID=UPI0023AEA2C4|nr:integrin alpha-PS2 isoform X1 [Anastrepha ludens]XP_053950607.1 integrin alpha-PS2 isoform X1 [Anastrepha ludens]XP_053950608.1 integrin alpha-PS2 isoform X1 [Anastrepha ludens]XP_053950609.1 integrin alpha-PS2 isoform X1 [Anastrepha ludens]XP_053950610.1 integrin alpha-PS2 isoform X1 [Anastrepha ludens]XP_053950611.1 integrin alpha-PS2 isoform X1 [Anastrepha ludens]